MSFQKLLILLVATNAPIFIANAAPSYVASFAAPAATAKLVSSERLWSCEGATCLAGGDATSPAKNICVRIAKDVGAVTGFTAKGQTFTAEQVAACNERAGQPDPGCREVIPIAQAAVHLARCDPKLRLEARRALC